MKKSLLSIAVLLCTFGATRAQAQVSDVNFIVSPSLGYTMWNSNLNLGNTATYGARVGFGFGPILELRGNYERSFNLKSTLDNVGWTAAHNLAAHVEDAKVSYERWGGDVKINLWNNARITPYILGGMGVLKFNYDDAAATGTRVREEKLYGNLGAGLKVNLARRVALSFELRDMLFNVSPSSQYATLTERKTLSNWNALASLDIYLGGTQYSKDEVTQAYRRTFNNGFRGLRFAVEPSAAYLNFRDNALYRDTWMLGLSAGVDFTSLIGVRGFYYRNTKDADKFSFNTSNDLSIYGANLITRLNVGRGVTPYLSLGAGYINAKDSYLDRNGNTGTTENGWFALGGAGLEIPLHRYVSLFGSAEAMLLNKDNPQLNAISDPAKVNVNWMYRAGVRLNLGLSGRSGVEAYRQYTDSRVAAERALSQEELRKQRSAYDERLSQLDAQLKDAAARLDTAQVRLVATERARVEAERTRSNVEQTTVHVDNTPTARPARRTHSSRHCRCRRPRHQHRRRNHRPQLPHLACTQRLRQDFAHQRPAQRPNHARRSATSRSRLRHGADCSRSQSVDHRSRERSTGASVAQTHRRVAETSQCRTENADRCARSYRSARAYARRCCTKREQRQPDRPCRANEHAAVAAKRNAVERQQAAVHERIEPSAQQHERNDH